MNIEIGENNISIYAVTIRVHDYVTNETVGAKGIIPGGGEQSVDCDLKFNNIFELDAFMDLLASAKQKFAVGINCPICGTFIRRD